MVKVEGMIGSLKRGFLNRILEHTGYIEYNSLKNSKVEYSLSQQL